MFFDTHAHYDDYRFDTDRHELLEAMPDAEVSFIVNAGCNEQSSRAGLDLSDRYDFVYATVGVHPHDAASMDESTVPALKRLLEHPKAVAVGEIGLDYHYDFSPRAIQKRRFTEQLELAKSLKRPVVVHEREAAQDALEIVKEFPDITGVFHCFSGSWETAVQLLDMGWYLSFTGVVTFKNARRALEVISKMPADRLMIETDCPYLSPEPMRGRRNSSLYLKHIAQTIANIRGLTLSETAELTTENGKRFFRIS